MADENCEGCPVVNATSFWTAQSMADSVANQRLVHSASASHHERNLIQAELNMQQAADHARSTSLQEARAGSMTATGDERVSGMSGMGAAIAAASILAKTAQTTPPTTGGAPAPGT